MGSPRAVYRRNGLSVRKSSVGCRLSRCASRNGSFSKMVSMTLFTLSDVSLAALATAASASSFAFLAAFTASYSCRPTIV